MTDGAQILVIKKGLSYVSQFNGKDRHKQPIIKVSSAWYGVDRRTNLVTGVRGVETSSEKTHTTEPWKTTVDPLDLGENPSRRDTIVKPWSWKHV